MAKIPKIYISIDGESEFNLCDEVSHLHYLGTESSPILTNNYQDNNSIDGNSFNYAQFGKNVINVHFKLHVSDRYDYEAKRQQIYGLFAQKKIFRLRLEENLNMVMFVRPVGFDITPFERAGHDCDIIIPFENPSGYQFSRYDSLNQLDLWDGFPLGFDLPVLSRNDFIFENQEKFDVINPGVVPIDPYYEHHDLSIHLEYDGGFMKIINKTNGTEYMIQHQDYDNNEVILNGINTLIDGSQENQKTNFGYIKLEPGVNHIAVSTQGSFKIDFEFPFIYV